MEDLQKSQNIKGCGITMPEGLKNLMFDISREVLRAQPEDIYQFIADYLSAMLVARDSLDVASHICDYICEASGPLELGDDLKDVSLTEEESTKTNKIINDYLQDDEVAKENLSTRLMGANIDRSKIALIKKAVEAAFKRKVLERIPPLDIHFNYNPEAKKAAVRTLKLYCEPVYEGEEYHLPTSGLKVKYGQDNKRVHIKGRKLSTDSSDDILKNIHYDDGGIKDLYVSGNSRPYKNSSLTSLAGSYGLAKHKERAHNVQEMKDHITQEDGEESLDGHDKSTERKVHIELTEFRNSLHDEVLISVDNDFNIDTDTKPMQHNNYYENEIIEEITINAENESDLSVEEEFD